MPIRDGRKKQYGVFANGVDNTTVIDSPDIAGTLSVALNCDLVDDSLIKRRDGYTTASNAWSTRRIRGGFQYTNVSGESENLVYGEDSTLTGTSGILARLETDGTFTTLQSGLKDGIKPVFIQVDVRCFIFNGDQNLVYDGTNVRQSGIGLPSLAPTQNALIDGNLNTDGAYFFVYRYLNSTTGARSSPSPASETFTTGSVAAQAGIRINVTPGDSSEADLIEVFRSTAGGQVLFLDGTTAIANSTYDSTVTNAGLGIELELDDSRLDAPAKFAVLLDNKIFAGGFGSQSKNAIRPSKYGINGVMPESYQVGDEIQCNPNDGDELRGLGLAGSRVIVIKKKSIGALIPTELSIGGLQRGGTEKYIYREISNEFRGLTHHTIVSLGSFCLILGRDNFYLTDGVELKRIGRRITKTIKSLNFLYAHKFSVITKSDNEQILFSVCRGGQTEPDFQFVAHYKNFPNRLPFTFYGPGTDTSTHPGVIAASFWDVTLEGEQYTYFGSSQADGRVYQLGIGASDNGSGIYWDCRLPWDGAKNPIAQKVFHSYYLILATTGPVASSNITFSFEENTIELAVKTKVSSVVTTAATWNNVTWTNFNWAGLVFKVIKFFPNRRAFLGRFGFKNTTADQNFAIKAVGRVIQPTPLH